jgi:hypothetical protein
MFLVPKGGIWISPNMMGYGEKTAGLSIEFTDFTNKTGDLSKPNKELINAGGEHDAKKHGETWVDYQLDGDSILPITNLVISSLYCGIYLIILTDDSTFSELCLTPINLMNG